MKVTILGSGSWEGIPVPFCKCRVCLDAKDFSSKNCRTRPEILVETEAGNFLIEISPDIRIQSSKHNLPNVSDFLVSHWHFDHMYGLLELHAWAEFVSKPTIFCSEKTNDWLTKNFSHIPKEVQVLEPFQQFELHDVSITPFPVYHMYRVDEELEEDNNTMGFLLEHGGKKVAYLADYYKLPEQSVNLISNADVIIADGTFLFEEHFPKHHDEIKSDPDHLHGQQIIDFANSLHAKKVVFHSIAHLSEKTHDEMQSLLPKNMFLSYDSMVLE